MNRSASLINVRTVAPDGVAAAFLLAFVATAGIVYINIMQALVTGLSDGLHISSARAGAIGAANAYGATLGAFAGVFLVPRLDWKKTAFVALLVLLGIDLASIAMASPTALMTLRFAHGAVGGFLVCTGYSVMARLRDPDRAFGICFMIQYALSGIGNTWLPGLVPHFGVKVLFLVMAAFSLVTLAMLPFLGPYPLPRIVSEARRPLGSIGMRLLLPALAAVFLFQGGNMGLGAYVINLGRSAGLDLAFSSGAVGASCWVGLGGAALVAVISTRFGRTLPIALAFALSLSATWLFHRSGNPVLFVVANFISAGVWGFVLSYLFGMCSALDRRGFAAVLAGLGAKLGLATGILLGGKLLGEPENYATLIDAAVVVLALSAACALPVAFTLDRRETAGVSAPASA
jgi:MFS transporter, DHA1 family, inner membrane transport protein